MTAKTVPTSLTTEELFCLEGCGKYSQYYLMRKKFENGGCPFCTVDRIFHEMLWEDEHAQCWRVPQDMAKPALEHQLLITPKRHVRTPWELTNDEALSMHTARTTLAKMFHLSGGGIIMRFGDMQKNAGTVPHLHETLMVPSGRGEVRIPLFKDPARREENALRAAQFAKRYEDGEVPK